MERVVKRDGATALWIYAPGYLDDRQASLEAMHALTGIRLGMANVHGELNVRLTPSDHPLAQGLAEGMRYGTGVDRELYQRPPRDPVHARDRYRPRFLRRRSRCGRAGPGGEHRPAGVGGQGDGFVALDL